MQCIVVFWYIHMHEVYKCVAWCVGLCLLHIIVCAVAYIHTKSYTNIICGYINVSSIMFKSSNSYICLYIGI